VREEVPLDLADFPPADGVVLAALRELPAQFDVLLVDAEFFVQFAERGCGVVFPRFQGSAGGGPEAAALVVAQQQDPVVAVKGDDAGGHGTPGLRSKVREPGALRGADNMVDPSTLRHSSAYPAGSPR
jgi:hypothetical protein